MPELEQKIARWRATVQQAMPGRPEAIQELEDHLRDNIQALVASGTAPAAAFDLSVFRLGRTEDLAMQFAKADSDWLPNSGFVLFVVLGWFTAAAGLGTLLLLALAFIPRVSLGVDAPWLLALMGNLTGYLAALALGVLGAGAQLILSRRPFTAKEQVAFRQGALQLTTVAIGSVSLGLLALMTWQQRHLGRFWTHSPVEWGSLLILTCLGTMLWLQLKQEAHDRIRYAVATLSGVSVFITWLGYGPATYPRTAWITPIAASLTLVIAISQLGLIFRRPAPRNSSRLA